MAFSDIAPVVEHISRLQLDVVEHAAAFRGSEDEGLPAALRRALEHDEEAPPLRRYAVNVVVDHAGTQGAPVVHEDNPTYPNLVGRIEHTQQLGALVTDLTLLRPGALRRAAADICSSMPWTCCASLRVGGAQARHPGPRDPHRVPGTSARPREDSLA